MSANRICFQVKNNELRKEVNNYWLFSQERTEKITTVAIFNKIKIERSKFCGK
jgi:hypothetical protein